MRMTVLQRSVRGELDRVTHERAVFGAPRTPLPGPLGLIYCDPVPAFIRARDTESLGDRARDW